MPMHYDFNTPKTSPKDIHPDTIQFGVEVIGLVIALIVLGMMFAR